MVHLLPVPFFNFESNRFFYNFPPGKYGENIKRFALPCPDRRDSLRCVQPFKASPLAVVRLRLPDEVIAMDKIFSGIWLITVTVRAYPAIPVEDIPYFGEVSGADF
jgi:hypothetical protein